MPFIKNILNNLKIYIFIDKRYKTLTVTMRVSKKWATVHVLIGRDTDDPSHENRYIYFLIKMDFPKASSQTSFNGRAYPAPYCKRAMQLLWTTTVIFGNLHAVKDGNHMKIDAKRNRPSSINCWAELNYCPPHLWVIEYKRERVLAIVARGDHEDDGDNFIFYHLLPHVSSKF